MVIVISLFHWQLLCHASLRWRAHILRLSHSSWYLWQTVYPFCCFNRLYLFEGASEIGIQTVIDDSEDSVGLALGQVSLLAF